MAITLNGNGTVTGISTGGLPSGSLTLSHSDMPTGSVLQVVETSTNSHITATNDVEVTGMQRTITPKVTGSKILVILNMGFIGADAAADLGYAVMRKVASGNYTELSYGANASTANCSSIAGMNIDNSEGNSSTTTILDSPSYSAGQVITYSFKAYPNGSRTMYINRRGSDWTFTCQSRIQLLEIKG